ncbi:MAG: hypothetical protein F4107_00085 [Gemmatimonadetes bacterium]|nr:hypothetical protein [Gemmatimonadota bacterium]MYD13848.1 hypothetical protein [Gemmatimonadota bacterium]MYI64325.1 hypothetical protein [Gemmatimonadota bacterium]
MKPVDFNGFPDESRIWIFGAQRGLDEHEAAGLMEAVDGFLASWKAHGVPLRAARTWRYDRFLIVCADTGVALPSGCSIDALTGVLREMEARTGVRLLGNEAVWYRGPEGRIRRATRPEFRSLATTGEVTPASVVFDNSITSLAQLRGGRWEGPAGDRWHAVFFARTPSRAGG